MARIRCSADAEIHVGGKKMILHGSPTSRLRWSIQCALNTSMSSLYLYQICLYDTAGNRRDCTSSVTYSKPASNQLRISGRINVTADYSIGRVGVWESYSGCGYSGAEEAFFISLPSPIDVKYGYGVDVTVTITISVSVSTSGDLSGGSVGEILSSYIADVLGRYRAVSDLRIIDIEVTGTAGVSGYNFQNTLPATNEVDVRKTFDITSSGTIDSWRIVLANNARAITVSKSVSYTAGQRIVVDFHFYT